MPFKRWSPFDEDFEIADKNRPFFGAIFVFFKLQPKCASDVTAVRRLLWYNIYMIIYKNYELM